MDDLMKDFLLWKYMALKPVDLDDKENVEELSRKGFVEFSISPRDGLIRAHTTKNGLSKLELLRR